MKSLPFLVFCVCSVFAQAQNGPDSLFFQATQTLARPAREATRDHLGNLYILSADNSVEKYTPDGRLLARFSQNRLGEARLLDVANPLKVLVFYPDFRTLVFLDRSLTFVGALNLDEVGIGLANCVAAASDGNVWVYDAADFKLKKLSPDGTLLMEGPALNLQLPRAPQATSMLERENQVFLNDPAQGIFAFNVFAQFVKTLIFKNIAQFEIEGNTLLFSENGFWRAELLGGLQAWQVALPAEAMEKGAAVRVLREGILVLNAGGLAVFQLRTK